MSEQDPFDHLNHIADGRILASKDELLTLIAESNCKAVEAFADDIERLIAARQSADGQTISVNLLRRAIGRYIKENKD